mgnify:CR=1 FL=1
MNIRRTTALDGSIAMDNDKQEEIVDDLDNQEYSEGENYEDLQ